MLIMTLSIFVICLAPLKPMNSYSYFEVGDLGLPLLGEPSSAALAAASSSSFRIMVADVCLTYVAYHMFIHK